jgi:hypothetical protein
MFKLRQDDTIYDVLCASCAAAEGCPGPCEIYLYAGERCEDPIGTEGVGV